MSEVDFLLSDEFVAYSEKIKHIFEEKKKSEQDFKKIYEDFKQKLKIFDDEAKKVTAEWETWKSSTEDKTKKATK